MRTCTVNQWSVRDPSWHDKLDTIRVVDLQKTEGPQAGSGAVLVFAEGRERCLITRFDYGTIALYGSEQAYVHVHLSALGCACAIGQDLAYRTFGLRWHIPKRLGGWR